MHDFTLCYVPFYVTNKSRSSILICIVHVKHVRCCKVISERFLYCIRVFFNMGEIQRPWLTFFAFLNTTSVYFLVSLLQCSSFSYPVCYRKPSEKKCVLDIHMCFCFYLFKANSCNNASKTVYLTYAHCSLRFLMKHYVAFLCYFGDLGCLYFIIVANVC